MCEWTSAMAGAAKPPLTLTFLPLNSRRHFCLHGEYLLVLSQRSDWPIHGYSSCSAALDLTLTRSPLLPDHRRPPGSTRERPTPVAFANLISRQSCVRTSPFTTRWAQERSPPGSRPTLILSRRESRTRSPSRELSAPCVFQPNSPHLRRSQGHVHFDILHRFHRGLHPQLAPRYSHLHHQ